MKSIRAALLILLLAASTGSSAPPDNWARFRFLMGDWITDGSGGGTFSFVPDLQERVLMRRSRSEYEKEIKVRKKIQRTTMVREDLMVIYPAERNKPFRAIYFDNEGQVIEYAVTTAKDRVTFLSQPSGSTARYRLSYRRAAKDKLGVKFEISSSGRDEDFKPYLEGTARKLYRPARTR